MPSREDYSYWTEDLVHGSGSSESEEDFQGVQKDASLDHVIRVSSSIFRELREHLVYERSDVLCYLSIEHIVDFIQGLEPYQFSRSSFRFYDLDSLDDGEGQLVYRKVCLEEYLDITKPVLNRVYNIFANHGVYMSNMALENFVTRHSNVNGYIMV